MRCQISVLTRCTCSVQLWLSSSAVCPTRFRKCMRFPPSKQRIDECNTHFHFVAVTIPRFGCFKYSVTRLRRLPEQATLWRLWSPWLPPSLLSCRFRTAFGSTGSIGCIGSILLSCAQRHGHPHAGRQHAHEQGHE